MSISNQTIKPNCIGNLISHFLFDRSSFIKFQFNFTFFFREIICNKANIQSNIFFREFNFLGKLSYVIRFDRLIWDWDFYYQPNSNTYMYVKILRYLIRIQWIGRQDNWFQFSKIYLKNKPKTGQFGGFWGSKFCEISHPYFREIDFAIPNFTFAKFAKVLQH